MKASWYDLCTSSYDFQKKNAKFIIYIDHAQAAKMSKLFLARMHIYVCYDLSEISMNGPWKTKASSYQWDYYCFACFQFDLSISLLLKMPKPSRRPAAILGSKMLKRQGPRDPFLGVEVFLACSLASAVPYQMLERRDVQAGRNQVSLRKMKRQVEGQKWRRASPRVFNFFFSNLVICQFAKEKSLNYSSQL